MEGRDNVRRRAFGYLEKTLLARPFCVLAVATYRLRILLTSFFDFVRFAGKLWREKKSASAKVSV